MERWHELNTDIFESTTLPIDHYFRKSPISEPVGFMRSCESSPLFLRNGRSQTLTNEGIHHCLWGRKMTTSELRMNSKRFLLIHNRPDDQSFSRSLIERLVERLEASPLPHLTPNEHAHLLVLIQAMLEVCTLALDIIQSRPFLPFRLTIRDAPSMPTGSAILFRCALSTSSINGPPSQTARSREELLVVGRAGARDCDTVISFGRFTVKRKGCYCRHRWQLVKGK